MADDTVLILENVKYKKKEGSLILTKSRLAWNAEDATELAIDVPYVGIKTHRISKEGSSKVQLQLVHNDGSTSNFHFVGSNPTADREAVSQLIQQLTPKISQEASTELEAKRSLLKSDEGLYRLYKEMVVSGLITAEEFWANRQVQVKESMTCLQLSLWNYSPGMEWPKSDKEVCYESSGCEQQQSGLPSAYLVDVEAISSCNSLRYNITGDDIQNIFRTYPSVKAKHLELVPDKMSEEQFWVQFFQSQKFHRNRVSKKSDTEEVMFKECFSHDVTSIAKNRGESVVITTPDMPLEEVSVETNSVEPLVSTDLVQRCNQHSALVLHAINANLSQSQSVENGDSEDSSLQLIAKPSSVVGDTPPNSLIYVANELLRSQDQAQMCLPSSAPVQSAMTHFSSSISSASGSRNNASSYLLSQSTYDQLCHYQRSLAELLRHFWACFPVINTQLEQKVHRMHQCLKDFQEQQLSTFKSQLSSLEQELLTSLNTMISTALSKYQEWITKQQQRL